MRSIYFNIMILDYCSCEGACRRYFHRTISNDADFNCETLNMSQEQVVSACSFASSTYSCLSIPVLPFTINIFQQYRNHQSSYARTVCISNTNALVVESWDPLTCHRVQLRYV